MYIDNTKMKFRIIKGFNHFGFDMLIGTETHIAEPLIMNRHDHMSGVVIDPTMTIHEDSAQQLMDELWKVGIRPSNGEGNVGQIGALKSHLEDMRKIAFTEIEYNKER